MLKAAIGLTLLVVVVSYFKMSQNDKDKFLFKGSVS